MHKKVVVIGGGHGQSAICRGIKNIPDIDITAIKYLGDATPQDPSTTTDDELDAYIAFQINVLSWAKRTQSWSF